MGDGKVNLPAALARITDYWTPHTVAAINDYDVKVVRFSGEFAWHTHSHTDELFLVVRGGCRIELRGREVTLTEGELYVVPRGVEHRPVADEEAEVVLIEPRGTVNTGD